MKFLIIIWSFFNVMHEMVNAPKDARIHVSIYDPT